MTAGVFGGALPERGAGARRLTTLPVCHRIAVRDVARRRSRPRCGGTQPIRRAGLSSGARPAHHSTTATVPPQGASGTMRTMSAAHSHAGGSHATPRPCATSHVRNSISSTPRAADPVGSVGTPGTSLPRDGGPEQITACGHAIKDVPRPCLRPSSATAIVSSGLRYQPRSFVRYRPRPPYDRAVRAPAPSRAAAPPRRTPVTARPPRPRPPLAAPGPRHGP